MTRKSYLGNATHFWVQGLLCPSSSPEGAHVNLRGRAKVSKREIPRVPNKNWNGLSLPSVKVELYERGVGLVVRMHAQHA